VQPSAPPPPLSEAELEVHSKLQRRLLRCLKQADPSHRVLALRCLQLQLPLLLSHRGASKDVVAVLDTLFSGKAYAMHLELPRSSDAPEILRRYAELLDGHASIALAVSSHKLELAIERTVLRGLRGEGGNSSSRKWGHPGVLALASLKRILESRPGGLGEDTWAVNVRSEVLGVVATMIRGCASSKHLVEGAPVGAHWLLSLQMLAGALRCLRLLWPDTEHEAPPMSLDELLPLLAAQICGTQRSLQTAASAMLATLVAAGDHGSLLATLDALTDAILALPAAARARRRDALQQVSPLLRTWLHSGEAGAAQAELGATLHRMQALALVHLAEPDGRLRGEAVQLLLLLSPAAAAAEAAAAAAAAAEASTRGSSAVHGGGSGLSVAACMIRALPSVVAHATSDPLQMDLWGGSGGSAAAARAARRLRVAASRGCLRSFAEAAGASEGESELWLCCLDGFTHELAAAGAGCAAALRAAWPMLLARCPRIPNNSAMSPTWVACASLAAGSASVVLRGFDDEGEARRADVERLLREAVRLLLSECEAHRAAGSAVLGQIRGGAAVQLVLSELAPALHQAAGESDWARHATKNAASRCHAHMRLLAHVLSLLSTQPDWADLLMTCGAPLPALAHWYHGAIEYLSLTWNMHAWSLQVRDRGLLMTSARFTYDGGHFSAAAREEVYIRPARAREPGAALISGGARLGGAAGRAAPAFGARPRGAPHRRGSLRRRRPRPRCREGAAAAARHAREAERARPRGRGGAARSGGGGAGGRAQRARRASHARGGRCRPRGGAAVRRRGSLSHSARVDL
jgi:hypothetical protein